MVFLDMSTQWKTDNGNPTGLIYESFKTVCWVRRVSERDRAEVFDIVRTMEAAVLELKAEERGG